MMITPAVGSVLYGEYNQTVSRIAASSILTLKGTHQEARQVTLFLSFAVHQEKEVNALEGNFTVMPKSETKDHLEGCTFFCEELGKKD